MTITICLNMKSFVTLIVSVCLVLNYCNGDECSLPEKWWGSWINGDNDDSAMPLNIQSKKISSLGECIDSGNIFYMFKKEEFDFKPCYTCILILERHPNVLQYKQNTNCLDEPSLSQCHEALSNEYLRTLFRDVVTHEPCPFGNTPFKFNYSNSDQGICDKSYIDRCSVDSSLLFRYDACTDMQGTEKHQEEVSCFASWKEGNQNFLVGRVSLIENHGANNRQSVFRCFNYGSTRGNSSLDSPVTGYKFTRSDPYGGCYNVQSPVEGPRRYSLEIIKEEAKCEFPEWIYENEWASMNLTFKIISDDKSGGKIRIRRISINGTVSQAEIQFICEKAEIMNDNYASFQVFENVGCKRIPICMDIFRRNENVMEIDLHRVLAQDNGESCHLSKLMNETVRQLIYTFVKPNPTPVPCLPLHGVYSAEQLRHANNSNHKLFFDKCGGYDPKARPTDAFSELQVGCNNQNSTDLDFYYNCDQKIPDLVSSFQCIATWNDGQNLYLLTSNPSLGVQGYRCFEFSEYLSNKNSFNVTGKVDYCKPSTGETAIEWRFKLKLTGTCEHIETLEYSESSSNNLASLNVYILLSLLTIFNLVHKNIGH